MIPIAERTDLKLPPPGCEVEPSAYTDAIREFFFYNPEVARHPTNAIRPHMEYEARVSAAYTREVCDDPTDELVQPEDASWLEDGFPRLMTSMVKASSKAAGSGVVTTPFHQLNSDTQTTVRSHLLREYIETCQVLSPDGNPSKNVYLSPLFLYRTPGDTRHILDQNADLGRPYIIKLITGTPLSCEATIEECRVKIETAKEQFPTISHAVLRGKILRAPHNHEASIKNYAEKHGVVLDPVDPESLSAENFLGQFRQMARKRTVGLSGLRPPEEAVEKARVLSEEAVATIYLSEVMTDPIYAAAYESPEVKEAFRQKLELLLASADDAWRHGCLPVSPQRMPAEFQRSLCKKVLRDFLQIHVAFGEKAARKNRVLYYTPDEVERIIADNPDIPVFYFRRTLPTNPEDAADSIVAFRLRVEKIRRSNPRLRESEIMYEAMASPNKEIEPGAENQSDKLAPSEFVEHIRHYLQEGARVGSSVPREVKVEIVDCLAEIENCFEELDWRFADLQIPKEYRSSLIKKVNEFIVAVHRAHRNGSVTSTFADYDSQERAEIYRIIADNYSRTVGLLGATITRAWTSNPTLYMEAAELADLRAEHAWLSDRDFYEIAIQDLGDIPSMLKKALSTRAHLKRLHPGLGDSVISNFITSSPARAPLNAMAHIRRVSEGQYRRYGSVKEPDIRNPLQVYKYYRTLIRYGQMPPIKPFDKKTASRITQIVAKATTWVQEQDEMEMVEEEVLERFVAHIEYCAKVSEVLKNEGAGPSMLDQSVSARARIVRAIYSNQVELNKLVAQTSNGSGSKFRFYAFGFAHEAKYMKALWRQYDPYMPRALVMLVGLTSPQRPYEKLNDLVEYRAELIVQNEDIMDEEIIPLLKAKIGLL